MAKFLISRNQRIARIPAFVPIVMALLVGFSQVPLFKRTWGIFKEGHYTELKTSVAISLCYIILYLRLGDFFNKIYCKLLCLKEANSLIPFDIQEFERAQDNKCQIHDLRHDHSTWNLLNWRNGDFKLKNQLKQSQIPPINFIDIDSLRAVQELFTIFLHHWKVESIQLSSLLGP